MMLRDHHDVFRDEKLTGGGIVLCIVMCMGRCVHEWGKVVGL